MYNAYPGASQYGQYGMPGSVPGMGPPGMAAPGTGAPPTMQPQDAHQQARLGAFPPNFQPPTNMPNINFSAPVIRLGGGPSRSDSVREERDRGGRRPGLGAGGPEYRGDRERPQPIQPQTKEEIIKTIFVGGMTDAVSDDESIERILRTAGNLRRWFRATDAEDSPCKFGFAEYEDFESLSTAIEVLSEVEIPVKKRRALEPVKQEGDEDVKEEEEEEKEGMEKSTLLIVADENSKTYIEQWEESQGGVDNHHRQMLLDQAREALEIVLNDLGSIRPNQQKLVQDGDGDTKMMDGLKEEGDVVTIQLSADDELSDIPAEMRATVAQEIAAFRDRSNRRDLERLKREEEIEQQEKSRMMNGRSRLESPTRTAPVGPGNTNGIPIGPRAAAPSRPKALATGFAKDYQKGVTFVNGSGISAASAFEDEDTDASDGELERRRRAKKDAEEEKHFLDQERRWLNRERSRTAAVEREKHRDEEEASRREVEKEAMAKRLREWKDEDEQARKVEEYYADKSAWTRNRAQFRQREMALDDADRAAEQREKARDQSQRERIGAMADDFLSRQEDELQRADERSRNMEEDQAQLTPREPARFKLSLGAAAQRAQASQAAQASSKRAIADVEGMLEDEEEEGSTVRRQLIPIAASELDKAAASHMTEEERNEARQKLAREIPADKQGLWSWDVQWAYLNPSTTEVDIIEERLRPFVEKKIVEYLGVQEEMLVDVVVAALRDHKRPNELVSELEGALDEEEAETLVKKLWRMVVFYSESERRGLST